MLMTIPVGILRLGKFVIGNLVTWKFLLQSIIKNSGKALKSIGNPYVLSAGHPSIQLIMPDFLTVSHLI